MRRTRTSPALLAAMIVGLTVACEGETLPYAGGLMLCVQTDLAAPKDISAIGLYITSDGRPIFADTRDVAPSGEVKLPATIAVLADADRPRAVIKIRAIAFKEGGEVRVLRDIITTIPKGRTALLRAPLLWINEGSGTGTRSELVSSIRPKDLPDGFTRITSACPDGQTFLEGECGDANVDSDALPDYVEKDVFGGGDSAGNGGRCFDVIGCFAGSATAVTVDTSTCSAALPNVDAQNDPNLSFSILLPASASAGECKDGVCLVPLDKGVGWRPSAGGVTFPRALCSRITSGKALGVVRTSACPTKDITIPSCGPASSVTTSSTSTPGDGGLGGDASTSSMDFDAPNAFNSEPNLSSVAIDADNVYIARTAANPPPPGVVKIARADVLAQKSPAPTSVLFGYGSPQISSMLIGPQPNAQKIVVRGASGEVRVCTPASSNDCPTFNVNGTPVLALGPADAYVYGDTGGQPGLFSIDLASPALTPRAVIATVPVASMLFAQGTLFLGMVDGSISKCTVPCQDASGISQLRAAPALVPPPIITALAADDRVAGKIFFMQIPADGVTLSAGGIFAIGTTGSEEQQLATGAEILGSPPPVVPPAAIAVDSQYVYWGGNFDDPRGGGRKYGLLRKSHVSAAAAAEPFLEDTQGNEPVSAIASDGAHVFWTYDRADRALLFARKTRSF